MTDDADFFARMESLQNNLKKRLNINSQNATFPVRDIQRVSSKLRPEGFQLGQRASSKFGREQQSESRASSRAASKEWVQEFEAEQRASSRSPSKMRSRSLEEFQAERRAGSNLSSAASKLVEDFQAEQRASSKFMPEDFQVGSRAASKSIPDVEFNAGRRASSKLDPWQWTASRSTSKMQPEDFEAEQRSASKLLPEQRTASKCFSEAQRGSSKMLTSFSFEPPAMSFEDEEVESVNVSEKIMELERRVAARRLDSEGPLGSNKMPSRMEVSASDSLALAEWRRDGASLVDPRTRSYDTARRGSNSRRHSIDFSETDWKNQTPSLKSNWVPICSWGEGVESDDDTGMVRARVKRAAEDESIYRAGTSWLFRRALGDLDDDVARLLACA